jgi:urease accessory protein UreF
LRQERAPPADLKMTSQIHVAPPQVAPLLLGDPHPLLEQLGAPEDLAAPALASAALQFQTIRSLPALRGFLQTYHAELLVPLEFPVILRAHGHSVRHEVRELIALDRQLAEEPKLKEFAVASCRVGQRQLHRLRPLRDLRLVRRYLAAVEEGQAHGWHTLVYGVALGIFSLPLRQGLLNYAQHTLGGFIDRAARPLALTQGQCRELQSLACAALPKAVDNLLAPDGQWVLRIV